MVLWYVFASNVGSQSRPSSDILSVKYRSTSESLSPDEALLMYLSYQGHLADEAIGRQAGMGTILRNKATR